MGDDEHRARLQRNLRHAGSASQDLAIRHGRALPPPLPTSDIDHDFREQQDDLLQQFSNHYAPYEGFDLLVSTFEKTVDGTVRATFRDGHRLAVVDENAVKLKVGLTFLPGADTPSVNQLEMMSMTQTTPDQRDPAWRVTTAGALLFNTTVHDDMTISFADNTAAVVRANRKRVSGDGPFTDPNVGSRALAVRKTVDRIVTIDSDNVKLVNELHSEKWDLEAVLVEVDQASLMDLISNYQKVIRKGGPDLPTTEIIELLDVMIEDARRLCIRSPVLFRMTTRRQIVASKNTRYGVDDGMMFKTLTTSAGIKNIILLSSSYFNSLPQDNLEKGTTEKQKIHSEVRPRFFQMLVLLLSLLNDDDLGELAEALQETYSILADRQHLELLILKVLPLSSINSKIFIRALVQAFDGPHVAVPQHMVDAPVAWDIFLRRLLQHGYVLPGTIDQLGCEDRSWVVKWPEDGFKDTSVFRNLQFSGDHKTINSIPPLNLNPEVPSTAALTVTLSNGRSYTIASADLENIVRMNAGRYVVTEAFAGGRSFDLDISDVWVNQTLFRAITEINSILGLVKSILPNRPTSALADKFTSLMRRTSIRSPSGSFKRYDETALPEIRGCGRLTYNVAKLNGNFLSLCAKTDGRKIHQRELIALLNRDINKINATVSAVEATMQSTFEGKRTDDYIQQTVYRLKQKLSEIWKLKQEAERRKNTMLGHDPKLASEPVTKVLYQVGATDTQVSVFSGYKAWHNADDNVLFIDSHRRVVSQVTWQNDTVVVSFHGVQMRYFASPLRPLEDHEKWEELKEGDSVLLCGHYLVVVEPSDKTFISPTSTTSETIARRPVPEPNRPTAVVGGYDPVRGDPMPRQSRAGARANGPGPMPMRPHPPEHLPIHIRQDRPPAQPREYEAPPPPRPREIMLEQVVNRLKVTGVEAVAGNRRGKNRLQEARLVRSFVR